MTKVERQTEKAMFLMHTPCRLRNGGGDKMTGSEADAPERNTHIQLAWLEWLPRPRISSFPFLLPQGTVQQCRRPSLSDQSRQRVVELH